MEDQSAPFQVKVRLRDARCFVAKIRADKNRLGVVVGETGPLMLKLGQLDRGRDLGPHSRAFGRAGRVEHGAYGMRLVSGWRGKIGPASSVRILSLVQSLPGMFTPR